VKPAGFDYYAPRSLEDALRILGDGGRDGRVLAGGQSLMSMLNCRILSPAVLVDINRIESLNRLNVGTDSLTVGALVRHAELLRNTHVRDGWPLLAEATTQVAHPAIRNRGTVCGSVSHNDPSAEHPSVLVTMDGTIVIAGSAGRRELPAEEFFTGMLSTALEPGEMVVIENGKALGYVDGVFCTRYALASYEPGVPGVVALGPGKATFDDYFVYVFP